jgi:hypothetical protein
MDTRDAGKILEVTALDAAALNVEKRFTGDVPAEV